MKIEKKKTDIRTMRIGLVEVGVVIVACGHAVDAFCPSPAYSKVRLRASLLQQILNAVLGCCIFFSCLFTNHAPPKVDL